MLGESLNNAKDKLNKFTSKIREGKDKLATKIRERKEGRSMYGEEQEQQQQAEGLSGAAVHLGQELESLDYIYAQINNTETYTREIDQLKDDLVGDIEDGKHRLSPWWICVALALPPCPTMCVCLFACVGRGPVVNARGEV